MKILASNNALNRMALCVCLLSTLSIARGAAQAVPVPASPESFEFGVGTIAGVAKKLGVHRRMVREAIGSALPGNPALDQMQ